MSSLEDIAYLEMAYALAEKARGWASPNPYVGAVCVRKGRILGYGYHEKPGKAHAEVIALDQAGVQAEGSTLYVTLEPCVHWGRTPPCVDAILRAKPKRVVVSSLDPNPLVLKKGIRKLRRAGIEVSLGLLQEKNKTLNEAYIKFITQDRPFVTLKAALSLDGRIATRMFDSRWISSPQTREYTHLLRGEQDAIMVGINTVIRDDPRLTVRHPQWQGKSITRVILDSELRFPLQARILSTLNRGKVCVFTARHSSSRKEAVLAQKGVEVIRLFGSPHRVNLEAVLRELGKRQVASVLVEGGSRLLTSFVEEKLADKIFLAVSPKLIGGEKAPALFGGLGIGSIGKSLKLRKMSSFRIGDDLIVEGYL